MQTSNLRRVNLLSFREILTEKVFSITLLRPSAVPTSTTRSGAMLASEKYFQRFSTLTVHSRIGCYCSIVNRQRASRSKSRMACALVASHFSSGNCTKKRTEFLKTDVESNPLLRRLHHLGLSRQLEFCPPGSAENKLLQIRYQ